ncbi:MAG: MBOAT family protein [Oscillospiraceae bacterium]|nr:MBOAT family protein [Oscillospiraceae bacterium]
MVFSSLTFLFLFLPAFFILYFVLPRPLKNAALFVGGILFYAWGEPLYVLILCVSVLFDYLFGLMIHYNDKRPELRKLGLVLSVALNLSLLGLFKYGGFVAENINAIAERELFNIDLALPIGISFYTFQTMSYTIDLYRRRITVQKNPVSFAAFVTMFPQIVAGPIVRYEEIATELDSRKINLDAAYEGICRFVLGLGKKVLIANNIGLLWATVKIADFGEISTMTAWLGILAFTFQIYFDFSGYTDMAIGLGRMLGFSLPENFNYPYSARSVSEFWRRWHMTLGNWFKSYVYFPLGGSRNGRARTVLNLAVVWLATGVWHGASWNFILWGALFGVFVIAEKLFLNKALARLPAVVCNAYVMLVVVMMWTLFDLPTLWDSLGLLAVMFGVRGGGLLDDQAAYLVMNYWVMFALCAVGCTELPKSAVAALNKRAAPLVNYGAVVVIITIFVGCTAYLVSAGYNPFLYFNF